MSGSVTMYSTPWCGYCHRLKGQLDREGISYDIVDIEQHPEAAAVVEQVNGGNQTVPTLVYADGTAQTNPSLVEVKEKLATLEGVQGVWSLESNNRPGLALDLVFVEGDAAAVAQNTAGTLRCFPFSQTAPPADSFV